MDSTTKAKFAYHRFEFPVRGRHSYGDGVGAPRVGHTHQGQDVLAGLRHEAGGGARRPRPVEGLSTAAPATTS